jgi:hypothetical protein
MAEQVSRSLLLLSDKPKTSVLEICKIGETHLLQISNHNLIATDLAEK